MHLEIQALVLFLSLRGTIDIEDITITVTHITNILAKLKDTDTAHEYFTWNKTLLDQSWRGVKSMKKDHQYFELYIHNI